VIEFRFFISSGYFQDDGKIEQAFSYCIRIAPDHFSVLLPRASSSPLAMADFVEKVPRQPPAYGQLASCMTIGLKWTVTPVRLPASPPRVSPTHSNLLTKSLSDSGNSSRL
jgi:hypothetical protein